MAMKMSTKSMQFRYGLLCFHYFCKIHPIIFDFKAIRTEKDMAFTQVATFESVPEN